MKPNSNITWLTVNNIIPIIASAFMIAATFFSLKQDVAVLTERVNTMIAQQNKILEKYSGLETRYGELAIKVNTLETMVRK